MRHKPLGVCSGIFHSDSQHRKLTFLKDQTVQGTRMGHEKVLPPCRHSLSLQIEHWCLLAPPFYKACGAINDSCPLQRSWGGYCRNKFQTQLTFKKPTVTSKFSSHPLMKRKKKWPQDKILYIPKYYRRNANQNDNKKSHPTCQNAHPHKSENIKCGREMGEEGTPLNGW